MREGAAPDPSRRALVLGALAGVSLLAGCGIRLEEDAPDIPLVPTREPLPDEALLIALTNGCADLARLATTASGRTAAALVPVHQRQHTVLRTELVRLGVPAEVVDAGGSETATLSPSPTASPSPTSSPTPSAALVQLGKDEGAAAAEAVQFAGVQAVLRDPVAALHAQRFAAGRLLTGKAPAVPDDPVSGTVVEELATRTEGARYLLEVVAARTGGRTRERAESTLETLRRLLADQVSGGSAPTPALGHPLPFPVESTADATRLAKQALDELRTAYGPRLATLTGPLGAPGWAAATRWLGTVEAECHRWGLALQPFPGLT